MNDTDNTDAIHNDLAALADSILRTAKGHLTIGEANKHKGRYNAGEVRFTCVKGRWQYSVLVYGPVGRGVENRETRGLMYADHGLPRESIEKAALKRFAHYKVPVENLSFTLVE